MHACMQYTHELLQDLCQNNKAYTMQNSYLDCQKVLKFMYLPKVMLEFLDWFLESEEREKERKRGKKHA